MMYFLSFFMRTILAPVFVFALLLSACAPDSAQEGSQTSSPALSDESPEGDSGAAALAAREHLADRLGVDADDIAVEMTAARDWSDSCLGLGGPAESCLAVITPGFEMQLMHDGMEYRYRTNLDGTAVRAEVE